MWNTLLTRDVTITFPQHFWETSRQNLQFHWKGRKTVNDRAPFDKDSIRTPFQTLPVYKIDGKRSLLTGQKRNMERVETHGDKRGPWWDREMLTGVFTD